MMSQPVFPAHKAMNYEIEEERDLLRQALISEVPTLDTMDDLSKVIAILRFISSFHCIGYHIYHEGKTEYRAWQIYNKMSVKKVGFMCSGFADIFCGLLHVANVPYRRIRGENTIKESPVYDAVMKTCGYNSHSTVEALVDGHWILADPTFCAIPLFNGKPHGLEFFIKVVIEDIDVPISWESSNTTHTIQKCYNGYTNNFFRDLYFYRVIEYKPFHKYPYDDVYEATLSLDGMLKKVATYKGDIVLKNHVPAIESLAPYKKKGFFHP